ncbi:DM13 domain-containing protein [Streptomyces sp. NBC_01304]|uniref:DM13 domain-containing protein n=1 Tax=Streptomyces sp. NBC_01304 TaxID=2903818 RepID=UPI002E10890D|nr:DM13 domain-containing protein [Streptomyces sp. NBC_01304]
MVRVRKPAILGVAVVAILVVGVGLFWFKPWTLWTDETVREEIPVAAPGPAKSQSPGSSSTPAEPAGPQAVATGKFISHEHSTAGTVKILRLADGSHTLRLEGLDTSNGPDLHVWITDAPVKEGKAGWGVFDDGKYKSLGKLKGNKGDQNYALPGDLDVNEYSSVSIWCERFSVSFGAAALSRA